MWTGPSDANVEMEPVDTQQELGRKGPDGGLGPKPRYLRSILPTSADATRQKKRSNLPKNLQQAAGFGGPAAAK